MVDTAVLEAVALRLRVRVSPEVQNSQVAELVDAKIIGGQRAIGEEPRKLRI